MYSGLVETIGTVKKITHNKGSSEFIITAPAVLSDCKLGDSLGVNGTCLTVEKFDEKDFQVTAVPETLRKTNLIYLSEGAPVNVERCLQASARVGGHFIQGHVDAPIEVLAINTEGDAWNVKFSLPNDLKKYVVKKGFVGLDGMSITVVDVAEDWFSVTLIPHTRKVTIASHYQIGSKINLEIDMMAKYVENLVAHYVTI